MLISATPIHSHAQGVGARANSATPVQPVSAVRPDGKDPTDPTKRAEATANPAAVDSELSEAEQKQVRELRDRDREVRAHEQAHAAAAGGLAKGGPSFSYKRGPDGKLYATGGEVQIDTSAVADDPQASIDKAQRIRRAALAPAQPSSQDRSVAAQAAKMEAEARSELATKAGSDAQTRTDGIANDRPADLASAQAIGQDNEAGRADSKCALCGGSHSAESHSAANQEKIGKTFLAQHNDSLGKLLSTSA